MKRIFDVKRTSLLAIPCLLLTAVLFLSLNHGILKENGSSRELLIISSNVPDSEVLVDAVKDGIKVVYYDASKMSPRSLLEKISLSLAGQKAASIALAMESQGQNAFNLTANQMVSVNSILVDKNQQEFFRKLGALVAEGGRIDILACDVTAGEYGPMLINVLEELTGVDVAASINATGSAEQGGDWVLESDTINVAENYFNPVRLRSYEGILANPSMVKDIIPGSSGSYPGRLAEVNGTLYFDADDGTNGNELWKSDGTTGGTVMVKDINPGSSSSNPASYFNVNGTIYFSANDGTNGRELWKSDGTTGGTAMVKNINPGGDGVYGVYYSMKVASIEDTLFFTGNDGTNGWELWRSDGTSGGTVMVKDINPGGDGVQPWQFDIINIGGTIYFPADDGALGMEFWKSDGSSGGTVLVKDIYAGSNGSYPHNYTSMNDTLYFSAADSAHGSELWKSGGTTGSTALVKDIYPGTNWSNITGMKNANGILYFGVNDGTNGWELWKSDGTTTGTSLVKDIYPGSNGSYPSCMTLLNGIVYFAADDGTHGWKELFETDGTSGGTVLVKDINPGAASAGIDTLVLFNNKLYFGANDGIHGKELWESDGTSGGTFLVKDIWPGTQSGVSYQGPSASAGNTFFFAANDSVHGRELWKYEIGLQSDSFLVYIPDTSLVGPGAFPGDTILIPVHMDAIDYDNHTGIFSFQTEITYNDSLFECLGYDSSGTILSNYVGLSEFTIQFRKDSGAYGFYTDTIRIAAASDDSIYYPEWPGAPFTFPRPLVKLKFRLNPAIASGDSTPLDFARFQFNEGIPSAATDNGSIKIELRRYGDVDQNGVVQPFDAVLVLRHVIKDTLLTGNSIIAAEVSGNGEITAYDAALILMYYVGKITTFPVGDYYKRALPSNRGAELALEWGELKDGMLTLLINAKNLTKVYGYSMELAYNASALQFQGAGLTDFTQGMINVLKAEGGLIRFAAAGTEPVEGEGALVRLTFRVTGEVSGEDIIQLTELILNEELVLSNASSVSVPKTYALEQNYPNPFNPTTRIRYQIPERSQMSILIYNTLGQRVRTLVDEQMSAGAYEVTWDGTNDLGVWVASGIYIYRMKAGNFTQIRKLILMK